MELEYSTINLKISILKVDLIIMRLLKLLNSLKIQYHLEINGIKYLFQN